MRFAAASSCSKSRWGSPQTSSSSSGGLNKVSAGPLHTCRGGRHSARQVHRGRWSNVGGLAVCHRATPTGSRHMPERRQGRCQPQASRLQPTISQQKAGPPLNLLTHPQEAAPKGGKLLLHAALQHPVAVERHILAPVVSCDGGVGTSWLQLLAAHLAIALKLDSEAAGCGGWYG